MTIHLPNFLTSVLIRLVTLRVVIASSILTAILHVVYYGSRFSRRLDAWAYFIPPVVTAIHHVGIALGPALFPVRIWMDILLSIAELAFNWYSAALMIERHPTLLSASRTATFMADIARFVFQWTLSLSLTFLVVLKAVDVLHVPRKKWTDKADMVEGLHSPREPWWKRPTSAMFGRRLWDSVVPGESTWLSVARGVLALLALIILVAYGVFQVVVAPVVETGRIQQRQFRTQTPNQVVYDQLDQGHWIVMMLFTSYSSPTARADAIVVDWLYPSLPDGPPCKAIASAHQLCPRHDELISYPCFSSEGIYGMCDTQLFSEGLCSQWTIDFTPCSDYFDPTGPEAIRIQVNFTAMSSPELEGEEEPTEVPPVADVYVGLGDTLDPFDTVSPSLAAFGFEISDYRVILDPWSTVPNANGNGRDPDIATLTAVVEDHHWKNGWTVIEEYRNKSVLTGFSAVGGLGAFFSTLLVILLGTSLMKSMIRNKEYSPLGLLHTNTTEGMVQVCHEKYPELEADLERFRQNPGLVAYLLDTLIAMGPLEHLEERNMHPETKGAPMGQEEDVELMAHSDR